MGTDQLFYWSYILTVIVKGVKISRDRKFTRRNSTEAILQNLYIYLIFYSSVYGIIIIPKLYFCYWLYVSMCFVFLLYGLSIFCVLYVLNCTSVSIVCVLYFLYCISVDIWYQHFVFPKQISVIWYQQQVGPMQSHKLWWRAITHGPISSSSYFLSSLFIFLIQPFHIYFHFFSYFSWHFPFF